MRRLFIVLAFLAGCRQSSPAAAQHRAASQIRTLDSVDAKPQVFDPPPVLPDEAAAPKPHDPGAAANQIPLTEADEQLRARLPFAPAIGLDPVDGSKVSIRATTPTYELRNKIYYFTSEENKQTFAASPQQFLKGVFKEPLTAATSSAAATSTAASSTAPAAVSATTTARGKSKAKPTHRAPR